jgi:hypothetical protein
MSTIIGYNTPKGNLRKRAVYAAAHGLWFVLGIVLNSEFTANEFEARLYSGASTTTAMLSIYLTDGRVSNWKLWFIGSYWVLHTFGSVIGLLFLGPDQSVLDYVTNFSTGITVESRVRSYYLSGIAASVFGLLAMLVPSRDGKPPVPTTSQWGSLARLLLRLTTPLCCIIYFEEAVKLAQVGYVNMYTADYTVIPSIIPLKNLWTNLNSVSWAIWFSTTPKKEEFNRYSAAFLGLALLNSAKGARVLFVVPAAFWVWYRARIYREEKIAVLRLAAGFFLILGVAYVYELIRSPGEATAAFSVMEYAGFLTYAASKAQYTLALSLDYQEFLSQSAPFWLAPIIFPITYLSYGSLAVGQSYGSSGIRTDLGHVLSSTSNIESYLAGAGTGSSMVAEAAQYGIVWMVLLISMFFVVHEIFFRNTHRRALLIAAPLVFQHLVFCPRDTMFLNTWGLVKLIVGTLAFSLLHHTLEKTNQKRDIRNTSTNLNTARQ